MFEKLKQRWAVDGINLALIISTFAIGGSLCGYAGKKILGITGLEKGFTWLVLYVLVVTALWPFCVLVISIPLGQFSFFKSYLKKIRTRMSPVRTSTLPIAVFASGAGSNAEKIIEQARLSQKAGTAGYRVALVVCNKPGAGVITIAAKYNIPTILVDKEKFFRGDSYLTALSAHKVQFIVLAGFLWKIPAAIIGAYPNKIINIHPALLPKYGGKGMYGDKVHKAVIAAGEKESGITIHYVDEVYDHGKIIFQATCAITAEDTAETLAQKIHLLEHRHYPEVIERLSQMRNSR